MSLPLHQRIREDMEQQILSGHLAPGDRLPIESELMAKYACSRETVNKAMSKLSTIGLIERRKGAGSFVAPPCVHAMILDVPDLKKEIEIRGQHYAFHLITRTVRQAGRKNEAEIDLARGANLLEVVGAHFADRRPLAIEKRLVSMLAAPDVDMASFHDEPPGSWLLRKIPWTRVDTKILAVGANYELAKLLDVKIGEPLLSVERRTWREDEPVTNVLQHFLGFRYDLVARFGAMEAKARFAA